MDQQERELKRLQKQLVKFSQQLDQRRGDLADWEELVQWIQQQKAKEEEQRRKEEELAQQSRNST